METGY